MATHRRLVDHAGPDFYVTPSWGTYALLSYEKFDGMILEPCCGNGAMAKVLIEAGYQVIASDLHDHGYGERADFLEFSAKGLWPNIVTNPPFNLAEDMLDVALAVATNKVAFLLRSAFIESEGRYNRFYSYRPPTRILAFSARLSMYPANSDRSDGGTTSYAWFVWDLAEPTPGKTELKWIDPKLKPKKIRGAK